MAVALVAATTLYSCSDDEPSYTPAENEGAKAHITFMGAQSETFEVEPGTTGFTLTLQRPESEAGNAETISLDVIDNEGSVFNCPASVDFAAGETEKSFSVTVSGAQEGTYYSFKVVANGSQSNYTEGVRQKSVSYAIMKWEAIGTGYWVDNIMCTPFSVTKHTMAVELEKAVTPTTTRFRFTSPYESVATGVVYIGGDKNYPAYIGYPYNEEGDISSTGNKFVIICDAKGNANLQDLEIGINWGYGNVSAGMIKDGMSLGNYSSPVAKPGKYDAQKGVISFPVKTMWMCMPSWNTVTCTSDGYLYLNDEAYLNAQVKEPDYAKDYTWSSVEGALGTYVSTAFDDQWIQDLEFATRVEDGGVEEGLYRFPDLFADGYPLVITLTRDGDNFLIATPKPQKTGVETLEGAMVYAEVKNGICAAADMQMKMNISFYTMDSKGNKKVDFGTLAEEFQWGITGLTINDLKGQNMANYVGIWKAPFYNLKDGSKASAYVKVTPSSEYEGCLVIEGLSALQDYNDAVIAEWSSKTGLLTLGAQYAEDLDGYNMLFTGYNPNEGYYETKSNMIGGLTKDGIFAFLNNPDNEKPVFTMRYFACQDGAVKGSFSSYVPYPMEWEFAQAAGVQGLKVAGEFSNEVNGVFKKAARKFNGSVKAQSFGLKQVIGSNVEMVY
ncbi:MAG: hypothetical protein ACI4C3_07070 [Bacteroides sp.]